MIGEILCGDFRSFIKYLLSTSDISTSVTGNVKLLFWWRDSKLSSKQKTWGATTEKQVWAGSGVDKPDDFSMFEGEWSRKTSQRWWHFNEDLDN